MNRLKYYFVFLLGLSAGYCQAAESGLFYHSVSSSWGNGEIELVASMNESYMTNEKHLVKIEFVNKGAKGIAISVSPYGEHLDATATVDGEQCNTTAWFQSRKSNRNSSYRVDRYYIEPGEKMTIVQDLSMFFDFSMAGKYVIQVNWKLSYLVIDDAGRGGTPKAEAREFLAKFDSLILLNKYPVIVEVDGGSINGWLPPIGGWDGITQEQMIRCLEAEVGTTISLATDIPSYWIGTKEERRKVWQFPFQYGDVTGDGVPDTVVAFYDGAPASGDDAFVNRARVAVLQGTSETLNLLWVSEGRGIQFRSGVVAELSAEHKAQVAENYFRLFDIDGDGVLDIVTTRTIGGQGADSLNVWSAIDGTVKEILQASSGRIVYDPETGEALLICDNISPNHGQNPWFMKLGAAGKAEGFKSHEIQEEHPPEWVQQGGLSISQPEERADR